MRWQYRQAAHVLLRQGSRIRWVAGSAQIGTGPARLNLGSGRSSLSGWINCDLNPFASPDIWVDLRDRWPLRDESVEAIYIRHCLEHFDESDGLRILKQCGRVLRTGGAIRIGVPSLESAITEYLTGDFGFAAWLADAQSIGRRFNRYMLDDGAHHSMYDFSYLEELLSLAGFEESVRCIGGSTRFLTRELLHPGDNEQDAQTLYVEARRRERKLRSVTRSSGVTENA